MLHIIHKNSEKIFTTLPIVASDDEFILVGDGVYAIEISGNFDAWLAKGEGTCCYALETDIKARGIATVGEEKVKLISDSFFVDLVCKHERTLSWK